jgi:hypothetical protein
MPVYLVTDPNTGRKVRLTGDSPPTEEELEQIFAQPSGQTEEEIKQLQEQERTRLLQEQAAETGPGEAFLVGAGRGLTTVARGLGLADPEDPIVSQGIEALKEEQPVATIGGEVVGEAAPFLLPGGAVGKVATLPGRVAASAGLGALEAGVITRGQGGDFDEQIRAAGLGGTVAGTLEAVIPIIGRLGGKLIRRTLGKEPTTRVLDAAGNPSAELRQALEESGLTLDDISIAARRQIETEGIDEPAALIRKQFLEEQGIIPTRAQVTGDPTDFQTQQELFKTSNKVRRAIEGQEVALAKGFDNAISDTGGSAVKSNSPVIDTIADRAIDQDAAISEAYKEAKRRAVGESVIAPENLVQGIKSIAGSDRATGGLASATRDILREKGLIGKKLKLQGRVNAEVAEQIRADMNGLFTSLTPFGRQKLKVLKDALDEDVAAAVGEDVFANARDAKATFEKSLTRAKVNKFDDRKKNLVRDILENKINPDRFLDQAITSKTVRSSDIQQLKDYLLIDEAGQEAWNDLRAESMQRIKDIAFSEVGGDVAISRANMERALDTFGEEKLNIIFSPEENKFLRDMLKVTKLREPKRGTALGRGPSAQAVSRLEEMIKRIPIVRDTFEGMGTFVVGQKAITPPSVQPLQPSPLAPLAAPLAVPLVVGDEE